MAPTAAVVEVFRSVQGEGYNTGRDAIFVRFAGCNLSCVFAEGAVCDTPYQRAQHKFSFEELTARVLRLHAGDTNLPITRNTMLILTGGEPTLAPAFGPMVLWGREQGFYVAVETNGTRWRDELMECHWTTVSPKDAIHQGSTAPYHNHYPQIPTLDPQVLRWMATCRRTRNEWRYVIPSATAEAPTMHDGYRHYLSPALQADGSGTEWQAGFPGFVPGAVERCLEIVQAQPRWRLSLQTHKMLGVR